MSHRHLAQEELLDCLLAQGALPEQARGCARCAAAGAELEGFLARLRALAGAPAREELQSRELVARILARTTRENLTWRGDLSLFVDFVRQRLGASRFLRLAGVSLLAHLLALPVFAWLALRPAPRADGFRAHFEVREQSLPAVPQEPERELDLPLLPEPLLMEVPGPEAPGDEGPALRRRLERARLLAAPVPERPAPDPGPDPTSGPGPDQGGQDTVARLLSLRAEGLRAGGRGLDLSARVPPPSSALERVLWVEILMDHLVLAGERLPALVTQLARVGTAPALPAAERRLEVLALERAAGLGLLDGPGLERLRALATTGEGPLGARGFGRALAAALGKRAGDWADWDR